MHPIVIAAFSLVFAAGLGAQQFRWPEGKRVAVSLSFDDARLSQPDVGIPLFDKHGAKATFYVSLGSFKKRLPEWKKAAANGHEIANHSASHPCTVNFPFSSNNALEDYTLARIEQDIESANAEIERLAGVKAVNFAYPCGQKFVGRGEQVQSYVPVVARRFLSARGFRDEMSNDPARCDLAQLLGIESDALSFEQMQAFIVAAERNSGWVIFAGHEIGTPARQTTLTATLEKLLEYAARPENGIWLDTVKSIGSYVRQRRGGS